jgi:tetratricopeptide (TPR) repeat protein
VTPAGRPLRGRLVATAAVLAVAFACLGSGLDRIAVGSFGVAAAVPAPLQAQSLRPLAQLAMIAQQPKAALRLASAAVAADPVDPASSALLGGARMLANDFPGAEQAFRVAAGFGWREPLTQRYWYAAALQARDFPRAAERLDALLRVSRNLPDAAALLTPLEGDPAGRAALLARLREQPLWLPTYLRAGSDLDAAALAQRSQVLVELAAGGTRLGCPVVADWARDALNRGDRASAERVWQAHCPGARNDGLLADGEFDHLGNATATPFGWQVERSGDVTVRPEAANGGYRLNLRNRASFSRRVLLQPVALPPGRYRLRGVGQTGVFAASLGCGTAPAMPRLVSGDLASDGQMLTVTEACDTLQLGIWLRPTPEAVTLDQVTLRPL